MLTCDICKKPIKMRTSPMRVYTHYTCNASQSEELDVCFDCKKGIETTRIKAEAEFYQTKLKESESNND